MASGSTNRLTTDPSNICISCKHQGFRDVLNLSIKKSTGAIERALMARFMLETTRSSYMLNM